MAERNPHVATRIREVLEQEPDASTQRLQEVARELDPAIGELSARQFNAGYVLPIKRARGNPVGSRAGGGKRAAKGGPKGAARRSEGAAPKRAARAVREARPQPAAPAANERDRVRGVLLEFARDFSAAESRSEIVAVLSDVDRYVDRIVGG